MIDDLITILSEGLGIQFVETAWIPAPKGVNYGVVSLEGSAGSVWADGHQRERVDEGSVDLFTIDNGRDLRDQLEALLNGVEGLGWRFNSRQWEQDTGLTHYEWVIQWAN